MFLTKLKKILQSNKLYYLILIISLIYTLIFINIPKKSQYLKSTNKFIVNVTKIRYQNENKVILELKGLEKLVSYYDGNFDYCLNDKLLIEGSLDEPSNNTIPNLFNYKKYLYQNNIFYLLNIKKITLLEKNSNIFYKIKNKIIDHIENIDSNKNYLYAFILGENYYLNDEVKDSYQNNGVSHLFAIGSLNISLLTIIINYLLEKFKVNKWINLMIMTIFLLMYIFLTNYSISIIRCSISFIIILLNKNLNLKIEYKNIMLLVLAITLFINPFYIYNIGFQYSYLISYILIVYGKEIKGNYFKKLFMVSFYAYIVSIPITIYYNYEVNFLSIIINLIFVPLINFIIFPLCFISIILPFFKDILSFFIEIMEDISLWLNEFNILKFVLKKPSIMVIILYYIIIFNIIKGLNNNKYKRLIILFMIIYIHYNINKFIPNNFMIMLDVKQGDAIVLHSNNKTILIDTGNNQYTDYGSKIVLYMKSMGIREINHLFITHGDMDHIGGSFTIVNNIKVNNVWFNNNLYNENENNLIKLLNNKIINYQKINNLLNFRVDNMNIYAKSYNLIDENNSSIILYVIVNNIKVLLMGDASVETEKILLNEYSINADIIKIGHHGSSTSTSKKLIKNINPKYSLISVSKNNVYHHPSYKVIDNLKQTEIFMTSTDGSIMIDFKKYGTFLKYKP